MTYTRYSIAFDRLSRLVTDFGDVMRDVYGWGDPIQPLDHELLLKNLHRKKCLASLGHANYRTHAPGLANDYYSTSNATLEKSMNFGAVSSTGSARQAGCI